MVLSNLLVGNHLGTGINMSLDKMSTESITDAKRTFKIDGVTLFKFSQISEAEGFMEEVEPHRTVFNLGNGEAGPIVGDTLAQLHFVNEA